MLANEYLSATIDGNGARSSVKDLTSGNELLSGNANVPLSIRTRGTSTASATSSTSTRAIAQASSSPPAPVSWQTPKLVENGPLRLRVLVEGTLTVPNNSPIPYVQEYRLTPGVPYLWMSTTGTAPSSYSVLLSFPLNAPIVSLQHGTTYHWNRGGASGLLRDQPQPRGFEVPLGPDHVRGDARVRPPPSANRARSSRGSTTRRLPPGRSTTRTHRTSSPASSGILRALRYTPTANCNAAFGTDSGTHPAVYALRVPSGLAGPTSSQPLREALAFNFTPSAVAAAVAPSQPRSRRRSPWPRPGTASRRS